MLARRLHRGLQRDPKLAMPPFERWCLFNKDRPLYLLTIRD